MGDGGPAPSTGQHLLPPCLLNLTTYDKFLDMGSFRRPKSIVALKEQEETANAWKVREWPLKERVH